MEQSTVQSLRNTQAALNASIDEFIAAASQDEPKLETCAASGKDILDATRKILDLTQDPQLECLKLGTLPTINLVVRIAIDLNLFDFIQNGATLDELVTKTGSDRTLLLRIMRFLASVHLVLEPKEHFYQNTAVSKHLTFAPLRDWIKTCFDTLEPIWLKIPSFLSANGYNDITDLSNNPTKEAFGANFFDALASDPTREANFASAMKLQDMAPPDTKPQFPFSEAVQSASTAPDSVFLVDVGGGQGQYLESLIRTHPGLPGREILQDLPSVVAGIDRRQVQFEVMAHDFFEPQPIRGAKYYHLRGIMHDWPDASCIEILRQLRPAFRDGHSTLLIHSMILQETGCLEQETMMDINLWTCCGIERDTSHWHALLKKAGFSIVRIVRAKVGPYGIIEAEVDAATTVS